MKRSKIAFVAAALLLLSLGAWLTSVLTRKNVITLDLEVTYQTITGWQAVAWAGQEASPAFLNYRDELFDLAVNDLGINRLRLEIRSGVENPCDYWSDYRAGRIDYQTWRSVRYSTVNDNEDPFNINWSSFQFSQLDDVIDNIVLPMKQRVEAKGERLFINLLYVAFTGQIASGLGYHHTDSPEEYAEFVLATYLHLENKYGWVPDAWEVILEPDNVPEWNGTFIGQAIVAAANRLEANGFTPRFIAPSNTNMGNAISYFDAMMRVPGVQQYLLEFSYHRYGGVSDDNLKAIASRSLQYGINTSMLEWWSSSNGYQTLHKDIKMGRNSAWEQGTIGGPIRNEKPSTALYVIDDTDPDNPLVKINDLTKFTRQYFKYIGSGAIRIEASSNNGNFDPLAFVNNDGRYVVVVKADVGGAFYIEGLPSGTYGVKYTTSSQYDVDLADATISDGQALSASIPEAGVITVYQRR